MKKIKILLLLLLCSLLLLPLGIANALESQVYYPAGIEDYVDLLDVKLFDISGEKFFYSDSTNKVYCYTKAVDKENKKLTTLSSDATPIKNLFVEKDYLFICYGNSTTKVFNVNTLQQASSTYMPSSYMNINIKYLNNKYYIAYIFNESSQTKLQVIATDSIEKVTDYTPTSTTPIDVDSSLLTSFITFTDNRIVIKPTFDDKFYFYEYPTATTLTAITDEPNLTDYFIGPDLSDISQLKAMVSFSKGTSDFIILSASVTGGERTIVYEFVETLSSTRSTVNISNMTYYNDNIYVYDQNSANIYPYSFNSDSKILTKSETCYLAGKGDEKGRFKNATNVTQFNDILYVIDEDNNRIQILSDEIKTIDITGFSSTEVVVNNMNNNNDFYYVLCDESDSYLYKNFDSAYLYKFDDKRIISIAININGHIFCLASDGTLIEYIDNDNITEITLHPSICSSLSATSKLRICSDLTQTKDNLPKNPVSTIAGASKLCVSSGNKLFVISPLDKKLVDTSFTFDSNILDFKFNFDNFAFVLTSDGKLNRTKITDGATAYQVDGFESYKLIEIDKMSGLIYLYNSKLSAFETYVDTDLCSPAELNHYYTYVNTSIALSNIWENGIIKAHANIYDGYYYLGNVKQLSDNTPAIILGGGLAVGEHVNNEFYYVAYLDGTALHTGYIKVDDLVDGISTLNNYYSTHPTTYKIHATNKNVNIYKYPTKYGFSGISNVSYTLTQGNSVNTLGKYTGLIDGNEYYIVIIDERYAYVSAQDVVKNETNSTSIKTNAKIKLYGNTDKIEVYSDSSTSSDIIDYLSDNYKVNVKNYDKNSKFTLITFIDDDQIEREGYVLTEHIKLNGLSPIVKTAIILVIADAVIAIITLIFFKSYRKKQKSKQIEME